MSRARPGAVVWRAEATPEAVAELRRLRESGAAVVPARPAEIDGVDGPLADLLDAAPELPAGSFVIRTSGSTGRPRRIVIPGSAFEASADASAARLALGPDDVWWASLSPAHVGGLALVLRAERLRSGIELTGGFDAHVFWELCAARRITHASFVPTMLRRVLEARPGHADPSCLRAVLIGGAAADPDLLGRAVRAGIPVATTWGMSETASQVATATPAETAADPTHAGRPLEGVHIRSDGDGRLAVRTPTMALGELVDGELRPLADADGWFATDDLGHEDDAGFVRITGRVSDRIITGGVNVDPLEIEHAMRRLAWVEDVAVVGVPDPEWGERVVAAVVVRGGEAARLAEPPGQPSSDLPSALPSEIPSAFPPELNPELPPELQGPRRPKDVVPLASLPRTASGKVDRGVLRAALAERLR